MNRSLNIYHINNSYIISTPLNYDEYNTMLISEEVLKKDWDSLEEDEA